MLGYPVRFA
ncbi:hypothetical protein D018_3549A, partial [Vibrio parahaemolyticus VP2007-007]